MSDGTLVMRRVLMFASISQVRVRESITLQRASLKNCTRPSHVYIIDVELFLWLSYLYQLCPVVIIFGVCHFPI